MRVPTATESPFGAHRVLAPAGVLPYEAQVLDAHAPLWPNEVRIDVEALNLDSASFKQLMTESGHDPVSLKARVMGIVAERGKMHNPVTGSGGVLIGTVAEVGPARRDLAVGERIVTLVSLTTTPLSLAELGHVDAAAHQIAAQGSAILFERGLYGRIPEDLDRKLVMSVLDVCGAPAQVARLAKPGMTVAILGAGGRSGLLSSWVASERVGDAGHVVAIEYGQAGLDKLAQVPGKLTIRQGNATDALGVHRLVSEATGGKLADLVINCVNVPGTEMASLLACRQRGMVYFFSMATSFTAAALGAESVGLDVDLVMGNGYAEGHADFALDLVRRHPTLATLVA